MIWDWKRSYTLNIFKFLSLLVNLNILISVTPVNKSDIVTVEPIIRNTSWLLIITNSSGNDMQVAESHCEREFRGSIRTFDMHRTVDDTILNKIGNRTVWNGYQFTTPWLENVGKSTCLIKHIFVPRDVHRMHFLSGFKFYASSVAEEDVIPIYVVHLIKKIMI